MKIAVLLVDGAKQIMLTPETDHEKTALKMIAPTDKIEAVTKWGYFGDPDRMHNGVEVAMCMGGYYRAFGDSESLMFLVTDGKKKTTAEESIS